MNRLTRRDEYGNADIISVDLTDAQLEMNFDEFNIVTEALNKLADYEEKEEQAEKGCDFCNHSKVNSWVNYYAQYFISEITPSSGVTAVEEHEIDGGEFNFCPKCGRRLRGE